MAKGATTELAKPVETAVAVAKPADDVRHGGVSASDLEMPKVLVLQDLSPDVKARIGLAPGQVINSISKEVLGNLFIPLFPFKNYAKFVKGQIAPEWSTSDRLDPRVEAGLKWGKDEKGETVNPTVTEFLSFLTLFQDADGAFNMEVPLVLSFKKTALRSGKQFLTLTQMKGSKPMYAYAYTLNVREKSGNNNTWQEPFVSVPKDKAQHELAQATVDQAAALAARWRPLVTNLNVVDDAAASEETPF